MGSLRKTCTLSNIKDLRSSAASHMCADSKERCMGYFTGLCFTKSKADANLYQIVVEAKILIIILYVDDLILTGDKKPIHSCKEDLAKEFEMKDMGLLHYFLGLET